MIRLDFDAAHRYATVGDLIEPLREAFKGSVTIPPRAHHAVGTAESEGTLLIMPSWRAAGPIGLKVVTILPNNPKRGLPSIHGEFLLLSAQTGESLAVIDGRALTLLRTAAVSALAAAELAPSDAQVLLMVGTGALARYLIQGHLETRNYQTVLIWGRNADKAGLLARTLADEGLCTRAVHGLESAVRSADVVSCATMAESALIQGRWLKRHVHLDLVGSFRPSMRESDDDCFRQAFVVVDTLDAVAEAGDLIGPLATGAIERERIFTLSRLLAEGPPKPLASKTVFKSVGYALTDLAAAEWILTRSMERRPKPSGIPC